MWGSKITRALTILGTLAAGGSQSERIASFTSEGFIKRKEIRTRGGRAGRVCFPEQMRGSPVLTIREGSRYTRGGSHFLLEGHQRESWPSRE